MIEEGLDLNSFPRDLDTLSEYMDSIDLSERNLFTIPNLDRFRNLVILKLQQNCIKKLPKLPISIEELDCSFNRINDLGDLSYLINLYELDCRHNNLSCISNLSNLSNLELLDCSNNKLNFIPYIPSLLLLYCNNNNLSCISNLSKLEILDCSNNKLNFIPYIPSLLQLICENNQLNDSYFVSSLLNLIRLKCSKNKFNEFLYIPNKIRFLECFDNNLIYKELKIECINNTNKILNNFKYLFYSIKFKKAFRKWLYEKVRLPKIEEAFSPINIMKALELVDINDIDEIDKIIIY